MAIQSNIKTALKSPPISPGQRYGRLTAVRFVDREPPHYRERWLFRCDCGREKAIRVSRVKAGETKGCHCGLANQRHGYASVGVEGPEYRAWVSMRHRCYSPAYRYYGDYGGRGIAVCERWLSGDGQRTGLECFLADMGPRPTPGHSLDRWPDVNGDYGPENCRWATSTEQSRNTRRAQVVLVSGRPMALADAAAQSGVPYQTVYGRLRRGWPIERALARRT